MKRLLFVVALCVGGLTACGPELSEVEEQEIGTTEKALACTPEGYCPSGTYCDWNTGLCRR